MPLTAPRRSAVAALAAALSLGVAACGSSDSESTSTSSSAGSGASTAEAPAEGITLKAAEFTWSAAALTTSILSEIAAEHPELGVDGIETTQLDPAAAWAGAQRGDVDLITEVALPNQQPLADKAKGEMELVSETYGDANQGWFVPTYAVEAGGELEGLTNVEQLNDFSDQLGGKLYDADPGWVTTEQNAKRLEGYGIELDHVTSGEAAELAELKRAYGSEEPIVLYLYRPHWVFSEYDMTQLEEDAPYAEDCFTTGDGACALPPYSACVAAKTDLAERAPGFYGLLKNFQLPLEEVETMLAAVDQEGKEPSEVAEQWVADNQSTIDGWIG